MGLIFNILNFSIVRNYCPKISFLNLGFVGLLYDMVTEVVRGLLLDEKKEGKAIFWENIVAY